jgi:hypothetical protein
LSQPLVRQEESTQQDDIKFLQALEVFNGLTDTYIPLSAYTQTIWLVQ